MSRFSQIAIPLFALFLLASCSTRKKTVKPTSPQSFEWLTANLDIEAEGNGTSQDLNGQMRIRKDSIIWFSVTAMMGVEVVRAKVSSDSVWVVNRMEKTYLAESLDTISDQFGIPLSLALVQTLLLDNNEGLPPVESQTVQLKNFAFSNYSAKVKYSNIKLDQPTTFPLKITDKMERIRLPKKK